ncbi:MAG: hypothetical protein JRM81_04075, partial [Nitrososphaerota archaeon]|nr:hypothetical protein [Nitrososphaerota archaeon]
QIGEPIRPYLELVSTGILVVFIFCALVLYTASLRGIHVEDLERNVAGLFTMLLALAVALSVLLYSGVSSPSEGGALFVVILVASWFLMNYGINRVLKLTG